MNQPREIISTLDLERLESLLEKPEYANLPGAELLRDELDRAEVVEPADMPAGVVTMNSRVRFRDITHATTFERTLVYPRRLEETPDGLSILAPVGGALLGLREGQEIDWPLPDGSRTRLRIEAVLYQPESAGEMHR